MTTIFLSSQTKIKFFVSTNKSMCRISKGLGDTFFLHLKELLIAFLPYNLHKDDEFSMKD